MSDDRLVFVLLLTALSAACAMVVAVFVAAAMWHLMRWLRSVTGDDGRPPGPGGP